MNWLTAQNLEDGCVHWWGAQGFQPDCALSTAISTEDGQTIIQGLDITKWVGAYLIPLDDQGQAIRREAIREAIRADGPTTGPTPLAIAKSVGRPATFLENAFSPAPKSKG